MFNFFQISNSRLQSFLYNSAKINFYRLNHHFSALKARCKTFTARDNPGHYQAEKGSNLILFIHVKVFAG